MILLSAIPGSGKSTWAHRYQESHPNTFVVSSDDIRISLFGKADDFRNEGLVWKTYLDNINGYAAKYQDVTVIADATNLQNKYRKMYRELTPSFDKHVLVVFDLPYEICLIQNKMRPAGRVVPKEAMEKLRKEMEPVSDEVIHMYDEYLCIKDFVSPVALAQEKKSVL
jgi:predicted kinase